MKLLNIIALTASITLIGCASVLKNPTFSVNTDEPSADKVKYSVTEFDASPQVVTRANQSDFLRFVNLGGRNGQPVQRVTEQSLFAGARPPSGVRPIYKIGIGDELRVLQTRYRVQSDGLESRETTTNVYPVDGSGFIHLVEGSSLKVAGNSIAETKAAIEERLSLGSSEKRGTIVFPTKAPQPYKIGPADVIRIARLVTKSTGNGITQSLDVTHSTVSPQGVISLLEIGEVEVAGLTLSEARNLIMQEAVLKASGADLVVEIDRFQSKSVLVTGELGTSLVSITDQIQTFDRLLTQINPAFGDNRDYMVTLERNGSIYRMSARSIVMSQQRDQFHLQDGDRITIDRIASQPKIQVSINEFRAKKISYMRVATIDETPQSASRSIVIDTRGLDLRDLLVSQQVDVDHNLDRLIRLVRGGREYRLSAQDVLLNNPSRKIWLASGDSVIVEDLAYVGENAFLVGEISLPKRFALDKKSRTSLTDALFEGGLFTAGEADFQHVYILRGSGQTYDAYHFNMTNVLNLNLADQFEMRPADIVFVRTRPFTEYSRAMSRLLSFIARVDTLSNL